jgi:predicted phosphodiesterase
MSGARYGVLSDVHGNLQALGVAVRALESAGVDRFVCLGDVVGYGPHPGECIELISDLDPVVVAGNHEQMALGLLDDSAASVSARASIRWTRSVLSDRQREILAGWPLVARTDGLVLSHGSLDRVDEYVRSEVRADQLLDQMAVDHPDASVLLLGHTHAAWAYSRRSGALLRARPGTVAVDAEDRVLLNPGSVGQSRDHRAHVRFLVLDTRAGTAQFYSLPYDVQGCRRALRERGLPPDWCYHAPPLAARLRGRAADALRRPGRPATHRTRR